MSTIVRAPLRAEFWLGVVTVAVALWLYKNYGDRLPRLPGGSG